MKWTKKPELLRLQANKTKWGLKIPAIIVPMANEVVRWALFMRDFGKKVLVRSSWRRYPSSPYDVGA